jgi:hypothetical protein
VDGNEGAGSSAFLSGDISGGNKGLGIGPIWHFCSLEFREVQNSEVLKVRNWICRDSFGHI